MAMMPDPPVDGSLYTRRMDAGVSPEGEVPTNSGRKRITWLVCALRLISSRRSMLVSGKRTEPRSEEHTSELQSRLHLVCRLLLEKKKKENKCNLVNTK